MPEHNEYRGIFHKCDQNFDLKTQILPTAPSILVEYDSFWGNSLSMNDLKCKDMENWGENTLESLKWKLVNPWPELKYECLQIHI